MSSHELPELNKSPDPAKNRKPDLYVQALLLGRTPLPHDEWVMRYSADFRRLYETEDDFRELVNDHEMTEEKLRRIQGWLDGDH